jgi:hypothetical protein
MTEKPDGGRSRLRRAARTAGSFGILALLGVGACRQIFGLDEAVSYTPDAADMDGSSGAAGSPSMDAVTQLAGEPQAAEPTQPLLDVADAASDARRDLADAACAGDAGQ